MAFRLYFLFLSMAVRTRLQYRADLLGGVCAVILSNFVNIALIWIILDRFNNLQGWLFWEIAMLYGMWLLSHSLYSVFFWHVTTLEDVLLQGNFDRFLLKPCNILTQFVGSEINYMGLVDAVLGGVVLFLSYTNLELDWHWLQWTQFILFLLAGTIIESCIYWIIASISFWQGRSSAFSSVTFTLHSLTQQYPVDIFGRGYTFFVTFMYPITFVNYYPLTFLLHKRNALEIPFLSFLSPLVAGLLLFVATLVWKRGIERYESAGS